MAETGQRPSLTTIGPLAFGADGTLFAADNQAASIYSLELGAQATGATPGATPVETPTGGIPYQPVAAMKGIEQLDLLDAQNSIVIARGDAGALNLQVVPLP